MRAVWLLLAVAAPAFGQAPPTHNFQLAPTGPGTAGTVYGGVPGPFMSATRGAWRPGNTPTGTWPKIMESGMRGPGPLDVIDVDARVKVSRGAAAKAFSRALPLIGTAVAIKDLADLLRCIESGGEWACDEGRPEQQIETFCRGLPSGPFTECYPSPAAASQAYAQRETANQVAQSTPGFIVQYEVTYVNPNHLPFGSSGWRVCHNFQKRGWRPEFDPIPAWQTGQACDQPYNFVNDRRCPPVTINGVEVIPQKGVDGLCPTLQYQPSAQTDVESRAGTHAPDDMLGRVLPPIMNAPSGQVPPVVIEEPPGFSGPTSQQGGRETTTNPDGSTVVRDTDYPFTYVPGGYRWDRRVTEFTVPPGVEVPPPATTVPGITPGPVTVAPGNQGEDIECGIPGYPACKIDETGTPTAPIDDGAAKVDAATQPLRVCLSDPSACLPALPELQWSFALPSACGPIALPAFAPFVTEVDVCRFQPMFHDLMTVVWVLGGLFGAIGLFWRNAMSPV